MDLVAGRAVGDGDLDRGPTRGSSSGVINDVVSLLDKHATWPDLPLDLFIFVDL